MLPGKTNSVRGPIDAGALHDQGGGNYSVLIIDALPRERDTEESTQFAQVRSGSWNSFHTGFLVFGCIKAYRKLFGWQALLKVSEIGPYCRVWFVVVSPTSSINTWGFACGCSI
jgi:hypothetical protein